MIKASSKVFFEVEKNERLYQFCMDAGAPLGEAYDVAFQILQEIVDHAQKAADKVERSEVQDKAEEESKSDEQPADS